MGRVVCIVQQRGGSQKPYLSHKGAVRPVREAGYDRWACPLDLDSTVCNRGPSLGGQDTADAADFC